MSSPLLVVYGTAASTAFIAWRLSSSFTVQAQAAPIACRVKSNSFADDENHALSCPRFTRQQPPDYLLISVPTLRDIARLKQNGLIAPATVILVDQSFLSPIAHMLRDAYPNNPVVPIFIDSPVYWSPDRTVLFHNGHEDCSIHVENATKSLVADFSDKLATSGFEPDLLEPSQFAQKHWCKFIPYLTLNVLAAIFDASDASTLSADILVRPLFEGITQELTDLAKAFSGSVVPALTLDELVESFDSPKMQPLPSSFMYSSSPALFYSLYHSLPVPLDVLLLNPILMGDDSGMKTPYLECCFALLSTLVQKAKTRILFQADPVRKVEVSTTNSTNSVGSTGSGSRISGSASSSSNSSNHSDPDLSELVIDVKGKQPLTKKPQAYSGGDEDERANLSGNGQMPPTPQSRRRAVQSYGVPNMPHGPVPPSIPMQQQLAQKQPNLNTASYNQTMQQNPHQPIQQQQYHQYQQQQQQQYQHHLQQQHQHQATGQPVFHGQYAEGPLPPPSQYPRGQLSRRTSQVSVVPPMPPVQEFDMMSMTQKRSRRASGRPFPSAPTLSYNEHPAHYQQFQNPQPVSQQFNLDDMMNLPDGKYGAMSQTASRRLSSARHMGPQPPKLARSQSFTSANYNMNMGIPRSETRLAVSGR